MRNLIFIFFSYLIWCLLPTPIIAQQAKLFTLLPPSQSGISFSNNIKDTKAHNILKYSNFYGGAGVGIGDFNQDGLSDLYFAGNLVGDQLYLNKGNLMFEEVTTVAGIQDNGGWSSGVIVADVNQDGWLDIYVTRELYDDQPELRKNKLYLNQGITSEKNGIKQVSFKEVAEQYGIADTARTRHATFLDYDKDGDLDLFLLNQPPNPGDYSKFYGTELLQDQYHPKLYEYIGDKFIDVSEKAGFTKAGFPNSLTASDLNGDGWTDLYVANDFWVADWYYINNGDGTFTDKLQDYTRHTSYFSMGVDAADMNNDGQLDIGVVDMVAEDNFRQKANMSGMNPSAFWKVVEDGGHYQYMFNSLHLNIGEGQLSDIAQLANVAATDWSWSILMADWDNDGWKDIFITNGLMRDVRNKDAAKDFATYVESEVYQFLQKNPNPDSINIWDIIDVQKALELTPSEKLSNYVFKNNGDLTFSKKMEDWGLNEKTFSNGSAYADLDNDGDLDLVINNINDFASIYENQASQQQNNYLRIKPIAAERGGPIQGTKLWITTDEGVQFYEITGTRGMYSTSETIAHFGLGELLTINELKIEWPNGKINILKNIKANQTLEVFQKKAQKENIQPSKTKPTLLENITTKFDFQHQHQENKFDDFKTQVLLPHKMSALGPCLATADVNGDGLEDFYIGGAAGNSASLYVQTKEGDFKEQPIEVFISDKRKEDVGAIFFDAENDGDVDLYVVSGGNEFLAESKSYQDRLYINDGVGNFTKGENLPVMNFSGSKVCPADVDKDGDIDLFVAGRHIPWAYPEPASSVLLINDGGQFTNATDELAPTLKDIGMVNDATWLDYDGDGWQDLVIVGEWLPITILKNEKGHLIHTASTIIPNSKGWWFSVESADMDGDGDEDIIAGNLGLNYKYKASEAEPFEVYYEDFDGNKKKDIVLTYYNYGIQYPLRGRQCSAQQIPEIKENFSTYNIFAAATATEVYGASKLEDALHYEATTFASTYFENKGNGKFEAHSLPKMAQISSINDILIQDFNNDQHLDILLAGNLYHAEVETTRNDAGFGLLLAGNGKGDFEVIDRKESGFFVPYNVKSMSQLTYRNGQLLLVGCNDDALQIFKKK